MAGKIAAMISMSLALGGCIPNTNVYFQNNTDSKLYLRPRELPSSGSSVYFGLPPRERSVAGIVPEGECTNKWLIYDENLLVVKDPGTMCWHDTVTIP
nr:hypothetical protein [Propionicimonas sp.]